jgi:hypothetical protein
MLGRGHMVKGALEPTGVWLCNSLSPNVLSQQIQAV